MFFEKLGIQKERCPVCNGIVFRDPVLDGGKITGIKTECRECHKVFGDGEWPPAS